MPHSNPRNQSGVSGYSTVGISYLRVIGEGRPCFIGKYCPSKIYATPISRVKRLPENDIRMPTLSPKEFENLLAACPIHIVPVVEMAYYIGFRRSEAIQLTWPEVDLKNGFIRLSAERTKTDQSRAIPIHPAVAKTLMTVPRGLHTDRVFLLNGVSFEEFRKAYKNACKDAGILDFTSTICGTVPSTIFAWRGTIISRSWPFPGTNP
jgi:integrase